MAEQLFDVVELDNMTGDKRTIWMHVAITKQEADDVVVLRRANITSRYSYEIVPTGTGPKER